VTKKKKKKGPLYPSLSMADELLYIDIPGQDYSEELAKPLFALGVTNKTMLTATNGERTRRIFLTLK